MGGVSCDEVRNMIVLEARWEGGGTTTCVLAVK